VALGAGMGTGVMGIAGSGIALSFALATWRWMFFRERPAAVPAALFAAICALAQPVVRLMFAFVGVDQQLPVLIEAAVWSCSAAAFLSFALSLALRAKQPLRPNLAALLAVATLAVVALVIGLVQGGAAVRLAASTAQALTVDVETAVDYPIEPELMHVARMAVRKYGNVADFAKSGAVAAIAKENAYVVVAAVDAKGRVVASSRPAALDFDFASDEFTREFLCLNDGEGYASQPFHEQIPAFRDGTDYLCKYVGMAFPGGGFVFIGETMEDVVSRDYLLEQAMVDWHVGKSGSLLLVDPAARRIVSAFDADHIGTSADECGILSLDYPRDVPFARGEVFGVDSFVFRHSPSFLPLDIYILMPAGDVLSSRDFSVVVLLIVLCLIYAVCSMLFAKITKQGRALAVLRAKEDAARKRDMELARDIQTSALPSVFSPFGKCEDFDLYACMRTAKEVGGDFFDFYPVGARKLGLVVADVSDKGVPAAMFMMKAKAVIRAEMQRAPSDLAAVMAAANDALVDNNVAGMFVTTWIGVYDLDTGALESVSAGHNPPFARRADGSVEIVRHPRGLVVGCMSGMRYKTTSVTLAPGDRLFLYTDGVTEAKDVAGGFFGEGRLSEALSGCSQGARDTCDRLIAAVDAFAGTAPQADDITVMTLVRRR